MEGFYQVISTTNKTDKRYHNLIVVYNLDTALSVKHVYENRGIDRITLENYLQRKGYGCIESYYLTVKEYKTVKIFHQQLNRLTVLSRGDNFADIFV